MTLKDSALGVVTAAVWAMGLVAVGTSCGGTITASQDNQTQPDSGKGGRPDAGESKPDVGVQHHQPDAAMPKPEASPPPMDTGPVRNHGKPSTTYPAFVPFMPQVLDQGGPVLASPEIVTVTWATDTSASTWQGFDDAVGSSTYWSTATSEYGVGPAMGGPANHVTVSSAEPTMWTDTDVANFVQTNASNPTMSGWPAPTSNTLYTIYLPTSTSSTFTLGLGGSPVMACGGGGGGFIGGYHYNTTVTGVGDVAYAVVIQCPGLRATDVTESASHELAEAVTDPHPADILTYMGFDDSKYFAWDFFQVGSGEEIGDMCEVYYDSFYVDSSLGYGVQRLWSNKSAAAGHAPCVPVETGSYFNVTPLNQESITVDASLLGGNAKSPALGYYVPVGGTKTFAVGFYSDGPTGGPWTINVQDAGDPYANYYFSATSNSMVTVSSDVTSGQNGNMAYITVTVDSMDQTNADLIVVESRGGSCGFGACRHYMPILISSN